MDNNFVSFLLVGIGGFIGAVARYYISTTISKSFPSVLPYGTLTVNLLGSFALGILLGYGITGSMSLLVGTGFMGAFTTFSTFKIESLKLINNRKINYWFVYQTATYIAGIILAFIGFRLVH
jgi:fluoride exporter